MSERTMIDALDVLGAMAMVPMQELLEHEEHQEPGDESEVDPERVAQRVDRLGQHVEERPAEQ